MPPDVRAEIERFAQLPRPGEKPELFVGRLMISEAEKAGKLERAIRLYDQCKGEQVPAKRRKSTKKLNPVA